MSIQALKKPKAVLDFKPHPAQAEVADAALDYRYVVVRAGRRFGKSALSLNIVLREAISNPGRYWIIAPEYKQAKSIYWRDLVDEYIPKPLIIKKNDQELILEIRSSVPGKNSIIEFKGSDKENSLRGAGLKGVVLDEYAFQKENVWDKIISPMLVQTNGWAIFITTPNGVSNHFKKFWDDAVAYESEDPDQRLWKTFHFTSYDYKGQGWEQMHQNLDEERKRLTEEYFSQEFLAEFAKFVGLIYTGFDESRHVIDFEIDENWSFYRSIDFGATDPNAVNFIGVNKDGVAHIFDEIYINEIYTSELAELIKQKSAHRYFVGTYADSAGKQLIMDLSTYGIYSIPVKKNSGDNSRNWLLAGINRVQQLLKEDKIIVHPRCKGVIKEFMSYSWRKDRTGEPVNLPEDKNNHCLTGETEVWTTKGKIPIKDLVGKEGYLYSEGGRVRRFYDVRQTGEEEIYTVEFTDGSSIRASSEHPFLLADGSYVPVSLLNANDLIQSVTYESNYTIRQKTAVQWEKLLLWQRKVLQAYYESTKRWDKSKIIPITQGSLGVSQWYDTKRYADKPYRLGLEEQSDKKSGISNTSSEHCMAESRGNGASSGTYQEHTPFSRRMALLTRGERMAFKAWQRDMEEEKRNSSKMLPVWKRIWYKISDSFSILPPELQNERKTKQVKRIIRERSYKEAVYNLEVEDTRTFVLGNGVLSSNCMDALRYYVMMSEYNQTAQEEFKSYLHKPADSSTGY